MEITLGTTFHLHILQSFDYFIDTNEIECEIKNYSGCVVYDINYKDFYDFIDYYFKVQK